MKKEELFDRDIDVAELDLGRIELVKEEDFDKAQIGYRVDENGNYNENWLGKEYYVIGYIDICSKIIVIKISDVDKQDDWNDFSYDSLWIVDKENLKEKTYFSGSYNDFLKLLEEVNKYDYLYSPSQFPSPFSSMDDFLLSFIEKSCSIKEEINRGLKEDKETFNLYNKHKEERKMYAKKTMQELLLLAENNDIKAQIELAIKYENDKKYDEMLYWVNKAYESGSLKGVNYLGCIYAEGLGVEVNLDKAIELFLQAAQQGEPLAQRNLGALYMGMYVPFRKHYKKAEYWLQKAAIQGDDWAQYYLGYLYQLKDDNKSEKVNKDLTLYWYKKASEKGNEYAQYYLATYLENQSPVNEEEVFNLYLESAKKGLYLAQCEVARHYAHGIGVEVSYPDAHKYLEEVLKKNMHQRSLAILADLYKNGWGVEQDKQHALNLYYLLCTYCPNCIDGSNYFSSYMYKESGFYIIHAIRGIRELYEEGIDIFTIEKTDKYNELLNHFNSIGWIRDEVIERENGKKTLFKLTPVDAMVLELADFYINEYNDGSTDEESFKKAMFLSKYIIENSGDLSWVTNHDIVYVMEKVSKFAGENGIELSEDFISKLEEAKRKYPNKSSLWS